MKKILVLGALSLFGLGSSVNAMDGAEVVSSPQKLDIGGSNVGEFEASLVASGKRCIKIVNYASDEMLAALQKLDNEVVKNVEEMCLFYIYDDEQAEHLVNIITRNSESLKNFYAKLEPSERPTDHWCLRIFEALGKCPNLEYSYTEGAGELSTIRDQLFSVAHAQSVVVRGVKKKEEKQEKLSQLISQAKDRIQRNNN